MEHQGNSFNLTREKDYIYVFSLIKETIQQIVPTIQCGRLRLSLDMKPMTSVRFLPNGSREKGRQILSVWEFILWT